MSEQSITAWARRTLGKAAEQSQHGLERKQCATCWSVDSNVTDGEAQTTSVTLCNAMATGRPFQCHRQRRDDGKWVPVETTCAAADALRASGDALAPWMADVPEEMRDDFLQTINEIAEAHAYKLCQVPEWAG